MRFFQILKWAIMAVVMSAQAFALPLLINKERQYESDLMLSYETTSGGTKTGYLVFEDLLKLPTEELEIPLELYGKSMSCRVLMLEDFMKALPEEVNADTLVADCVDGYFSYFPKTFIDEYKPFFVLQIGGENPVSWPRTASGSWMGPYLILVSEMLAPQFKNLQDSEHKLPWGVTHVKLVQYKKTFAPLYSGQFADLNETEEYGRWLYLENCASCHGWGEKSFGGTKSNRSFPIIATHAAYNEKYFLKYIKNPQAVVPTSTMPAQSHYSEKEYRALIEFLKINFKK